MEEEVLVLSVLEFLTQGTRKYKSTMRMVEKLLVLKSKYKYKFEVYFAFFSEDKSFLFLLGRFEVLGSSLPSLEMTLHSSPFDQVLLLSSLMNVIL